MNQKLVKKIRKIAYSNTSSSDERAARKWVVLEDKKQHRILACLDPRATYKAVKNNFKGGTPAQKKIMRQEIALSLQTVKEKFPRGIIFGDKRTFLGRELPSIGGENAPRQNNK